MVKSPAGLTHSLGGAPKSLPDLRYQTARELVRKTCTFELRKLGVDVADDEQVRDLAAPFSSTYERSAILFAIVRSWKSLRPICRHASISLLPAVLYLVLSLSAVGVVPNLNFWMFDFWFRIRGPSKPPANIVVVRIDEDSYKQLNTSGLEAWPREFHTKLLNRLASIQPRGVIFDIVFHDAASTEVDQRLADAMSRVPTFLAKGVREKITNGLAESMLETETIDPHPRFIAAAKGVFSIGLRSDQGIARRLPVVGREGFEYPPLAPVAFENERSTRDDVPSPGDFINYYGPSHTIKSVSYAELLNPKKAIDDYRNAWLVVGFMRALPTKSKLTDTFQTPFRTKMAGVEILATMLGNLLERKWIRDFSPYIEGFGGAWFVFMVGFILRHLRFRSAGWVGCSVVVSLPLVQCMFLATEGYVPVMGVALIVGITLVVDLFIRTNQIRRMFAGANYD